LILPSNLVSRLEVYKTPQADIQEGSLGGTISLRTRRPLESDANTISIQARGQYSDNADKFDPEASALYSWKNVDETFGVLASYTYQRRNVARTGREVVGYVNPADNPSGTLLPRLIGETDFRQLRERRTFFGSVQWKPTEQFELLFNTLDTRFKANNINQNNLGTFGSDGAILDVRSVETAGSGPAAGVIAARIDATPGGAGARTQAFDRRSNINGQVYDLQGTYEGEQYTLTARVGRTTSEGGAPDERFFGFTSEGARPAGATPGAVDVLTFDKNLNLGFITAAGPETEAQYLSRPFEFGNARSTVNTEDEDYAGLDFSYDVDGDVFKRIKVGALYQDHGVGRRATLTGLQWFSDSQHISPTGGYGGTNLRDRKSTRLNSSHHG
jgi:iron complex outermembrane receptor protein